MSDLSRTVGVNVDKEKNKRRLSDVINEMRNTLVDACNFVEMCDCECDECTLLELCELTPGTPSSKTKSDIIIMYYDALKRGLIKVD